MDASASRGLPNQTGNAEVQVITGGALNSGASKGDGNQASGQDLGAVLKGSGPEAFLLSSVTVKCGPHIRCDHKHCCLCLFTHQRGWLAWQPPGPCNKLG